MRPFPALLTGIVFGIGLAISGMIDPAKVVGFLDVTGNWDPTLIVVMASALVVATPIFQITLRRRRAVFDPQLHNPTRHDITARLVIGSAIFGIGWGIGGFCPGPAVSAISHPEALLTVIPFLIALVVGQWLSDRYFDWLAQRQQAGAQDGKATPVAGRH